MARRRKQREAAEEPPPFEIPVESSLRCQWVTFTMTDENGASTSTPALIPGCSGVAYTGDIAQCTCHTFETECRARVQEAGQKLRLERRRCQYLEQRLENPAMRHGWDERAALVHGIYERFRRKEWNATPKENDDG
jgi:hypothetical protein